MSSSKLIGEVKAIIPPLLESMHKGQAGKIAVIGGCAEYTGIISIFTIYLHKDLHKDFICEWGAN